MGLDSLSIDSHFITIFMIKKSTLLFAVALLLALPSRAQFLDFTQNDDRVFMGVHLGQAGTGTKYPGFAGGFSVSVCGVYVDFLLSPPRYEDDNHIVNELWDDDEAFSINIGYQIPVFPWLRIAPIIGYSQTNWGYIDASTINLEVNDNGSIRNHHDYEIEGRDHDFNYGGALFIKPFDHIEFYGVYTLRGIYGGINVDLNWTGLFGD